MSKNMIEKISFLLILILAIFFRIWHLSSLPPALYYDEIDAGYQAQNFIQNNSDYYGNKFPIHFRSFGDYRTSLYIYSVALTQKFIPNPDLSVRLPSVIFGVVSVVLMYLITKSTIPCLLLAISPWAIHYSRIAFEASGMIMVILAGIYFWKKYHQKSLLKHLLLSVFFFALSPYFYSTSKLFLIFIAITIFFIYFSFIKKIKVSHLLIAGLFGILLMTPLLIDTIKGNSGFRFSYISIFTEPQLAQTTDYLRYQDIYTTHHGQTGVSPSFSSRFFHNKYSLIVQKFLTNYFSSFSTDFLFIHGDQNFRHGFGTHGLLYYFDFFLIFFGLINVIKNRRRDHLGMLFTWILVFAPIPFALTRDSTGPHATRLILMLPSFVYLVYQGILYLQYLYKPSLYFILAVYAMSFATFWHYYNFEYPQTSAMDWNTGMKESVLVANKYPNNPLLFSDSYISFVSFFLYYHPYNLSANDSIKNHLLEYSNNSFAGQVLDNKYYFGRVNWANLSDLPQNTIYIIPKSEEKLISKDLKKIDDIDKKYINSEAFSLYTIE